MDTVRPVDRKRRVLIAAMPSLLAALTRSARAQSAPLPRVVMVMQNAEDVARPWVESFRAGMRDAGQVEGRTWTITYLYGNLDPSRIESVHRQAVAERPDVVVVGGVSAARLMRDLTTTIPVVVATAGDLIEAGVVESFARPGGNVTGVSDLADVAAVKRLELVRVALPRAKRVALITNPRFPPTPRIESRVAEAAPRLGFAIVNLRASDRTSLATALGAMTRDRPDALVVGGDPLFNSSAFMEPAVATRVPIVHYWQGTAQAGALMSYEVDVLDNFRRAAGYVDRILKGARPGDLPIHQPTRYRLVVNLKVARLLGVDVAPALLQRADEIIE